MNDIDFARLISPGIGAAYESAQAHCGSLPKHALVELRSMAKLCSNLLASFDPLGEPVGNLESRIDWLMERKVIDRVAMSLLHDLRRKGNIGAHPEDFNLKEEQLFAQARAAMESARTLLAWMFKKVNGGGPAPKFEIAPVDDGHLRKLCYQAVIESDPEAERILGKLFHQRSIEAFEASKVKIIASNGGWIGGAEFMKQRDKALFWLRSASASLNPQAMHDYGAALAAGAEGTDKIVEGERLILQAAELGNADADAFIGKCYLLGSKAFDVDYGQALEHLRRAAEEDHPGALANLGVMLHDGLGVERDLAGSAQLTLRAARAGFPQAQFNAFYFHYHGEGLSRDEGAALKWLRASSDQGYSKARLTLASFMRAGLVAHSGFDEIEALIRSTLADDNSSRLELAELYLDEKSDAAHALEAAGLVQLCYEIAMDQDNPNLAERCAEAAPRAIEAVKKRMAQMDKDMVVSAFLTLALFDEKQRPVRDRAAQSRKTMGAMIDAAKAAKKLPPARVRPHGSLPGLGTLPRVPSAPSTPTRNGIKQGRNDPCSCNSGKKFKNCHGA